MSECKFCKFELVEKGDGEWGGDYFEGASIVSEDDTDSVMTLSKLSDGGTTMYVRHESEWDERIDYRVGNVDGSIKLPIWYDATSFFDVRYCPLCGRKL